ncbi:hypothetical protein FRAHR75_2110002 [Frankia sp. Hr75.2]|nr:hypothetical protein FRAHR75_2110002 [Frankia sp. Hr75.2]
MLPYAPVSVPGDGVPVAAADGGTLPGGVAGVAPPEGAPEGLAVTSAEVASAAGVVGAADAIGARAEVGAAVGAPLPACDPGPGRHPAKPIVTASAAGIMATANGMRRLARRTSIPSSLILTMSKSFQVVSPSFPSAGETAAPAGR